MHVRDTEGLAPSRSWLPICQEEARQEFLDTYHAGQVTIFVGGTSCGKTIQVFKFTLFDKWEGGLLVACTQPRMIAATNLARTQMEGVVDTNTGRKCSVATNVAEASFTIGGITFMIGNEQQSVDH
ncbi:hypothetical protein CDV36_010741 [Fusarium kuroshium]|uniref:RNA helicase n=1 Tax=Fusarium kuroshium TaxID=2010991 RepID=A0A3M2RWV9_9HYPO|nr:hypothetical protein CDV36_010741 [Fusarium kuroshium]